jgi:hypothetical protein
LCNKRPDKTARWVCRGKRHISEAPECSFGIRKWIPNALT